MDKSRLPPRSLEGEPEQTEDCVSFGAYTLWPRARVLHDSLGPVQLGGRALDLLIVLVRHAGELVSKEDLMRAVWPDVSVSEGNLRVHVTALRKALGSGEADARYVVNVAGRGYSFVARVTRRVPLALMERRDERAITRSSVIGRDELVLSLGDRLQRPALVSLVGGGGLGKTTVAREVARRFLRDGERQVHWVELSHVFEDRSVLEECAAALRLRSPPQDALAAIVRLLGDAPSLLVLDCCERAVRGVALLVEKLTDELPSLAILATSREALRARGEEVLRLPPLSLPEPGAPLTEATARDFSALRLFLERAESLGAALSPGEADLSRVARLCEKLDGIPLAIELAAGHLTAFGLDDLVTILERRLTLVDVGRRTAEPRHQTMQATLDWSYGLLSENERLLLERLSVFEGAATLRAIVSVTGFAPLGEAEVLQAVAGLVDKSLLVPRTYATGIGYRLLDTTRTYALGCAEKSAEAALLSRKLAGHVLEEMSASRRIEGHKSLADAWLGPCCPNLTNLRVAVSWALASEAEAPLALDLIGAATPLLMQLSMLAECERLAAQGRALLRAGDEATSELQMRLAAFEGAAALGTRGPVEEALSALEGALALAQHRGDVHYQGLVLSGLYWLWIYRGEAARAVETAKLIATIDVEPDESAASISANYVAMATTQLGSQSLALPLLETAVERRAPHVDLGRFMRIGSDPSVFTQVFRIKTLWLVGQPERALELYAQCRAALQAPEHALYNCWALNEVMIPLYCDQRDFVAARAVAEELQQAASAQSMAIRVHAARAAALAIELLTGANELDSFERELALLHASRFASLIPWLEDVAVQVLARQGRVAPALARLEAAIRACELSNNGWWLAELLRQRAELLERLHPDAPASAGLESARRAHALARAQGALTLARRAARTWVDLARQTADAIPAREALSE